MSNIIAPRAFISIASVVFVFFFTVHVNYHEIFALLKMHGFSNDEVDLIDIVEILAAISGGITLTHLINNYPEEKLIFISYLTYLICMVNMTMLENYKLFVTNLMIMAISRFIFCATALIKFINYFKSDIKKAIMLYFFIWAFAFITGDYSIKLAYDFKVSSILLSLSFIQILVIFYSYLSNRSSKIIANYKPNFIPLIAAIELEALIDFTLSYIIFSIYWDWEVFADDNGYSVTDFEYVRFNVILGILFSLYPVKILINNFNKFKSNIYMLLVFVGILILIQVTGKYNEIYSKLIFGLMGAIMYALFINNLLILADKFIDSELNYAIALYLCISVIGGYIGIIATDNMIETFGRSGFLISLYSVSIILLIYYLLQFFSRRLYRL